MNILHTSDWHLGKALYRKKRYNEFENFLDWLYDTILTENIEVLLVAGDVFDTTTPSNKAQSLYYNFLVRVAASKCRYIIITAGNHDSPSFLTAPKELLGTLNVFVVGSVPEKIDDEIFVLSNEKDEKLIVCAIPYLSDRDIRKSEAGESIDEKKNKLLDGIKQHYIDICEIAEKKQKELPKNTPIIAMGHLFTAKGKTSDDDGVREIYVGSLAKINKSSFPTIIDYLALGHLHIPQLVDNSDNMRYSGSPIPMGFGESKQDKKVIKINFNAKSAEVKEISIPSFQKLRQISGDLDKIISQIEEYKSENKSIWLEIEYKGDEVASNLNQIINDAITGSKVEVLRIKNQRIIERILKSTEKEETLDKLTEYDVFEKCLDAHNILEEERIELRNTYQETIQIMNEEDVRA